MHIGRFCEDLANGNNMCSIETVATNKQLFTMDIAVLCGNRLSYFDESVGKIQAAVKLWSVCT